MKKILIIGSGNTIGIASTMAALKLENAEVDVIVQDTVLQEERPEVTYTITNHMPPEKSLLTPPMTREQRRKKKRQQK